MSALVVEDVLLFERFRLDRRGGGLSRRDQRGVFVPVAIGSRALDVLGVLVERAGDMVSRDQIIAAVWPATVVEDNNLNIQIASLRRILDQGRGQSCIQTIPGRGYRFTASVTRLPETPTSLGASPDEGVSAPADADAWTSRTDASSQSNQTYPSGSGRSRSGRGILAAVIGVVLLVAVGVVWRHLRPPNIAEISSAPRLSIVILPFANLSNDPGQQYFADGVTEDLTTDLSRIADMFVISANTAFTYRSKPDAKQIGRELSVRYVLEGSVQRAGDRVRVNAQLIDAETDAHLWAERFDRDASDLFALQDEITRRIASALNIEITAVEAARPAQNADALDYVLRGRAALYKPASSENDVDAINSFEHALELDPQSIDAQLELAQILVSRVLDFGGTNSAADAKNIKRAATLADRALAAAPRSPYAHYIKGQALRAQRRCADAISEYETVLALDHNAAAALANKGRCLIYIGPVAEAIPLLEQTIRLSPRDPRIAVWYWRIGEARLLQSHIDDAVLWLEKAHDANPALPYVHAYLAAAYALKGDTQRAAAELANARKLVGGGVWQKFSRVKATRRYETPAIRALAEATLIEGLCKAGMPEE